MIKTLLFQSTLGQYTLLMCENMIQCHGRTPKRHAGSFSLQANEFPLFPCISSIGLGSCLVWCQVSILSNVLITNHSRTCPPQKTLPNFRSESVHTKMQGQEFLRVTQDSALPLSPLTTKTGATHSAQRLKHISVLTKASKTALEENKYINFYILMK